MSTLPSIKPLKYRKRCQRYCPSVSKITLKIFFEKKKRANHHRDSHYSHSLYHKFINKVFFRAFEIAAKQSLFLRLHGKSHIKKTIGNKVEPDDLGWQKRKRKS